MGMPEEVRAAVELVTEKVVQTAADCIQENLVAATPVDTTHAKNNWIVGIGTPFSGVDGSRKAPSTTAQEKGIQSLRAYRLSQGVVYITNSVPYMIYLVLGHSAQAPAGFDRAAVERGILDAAKRLS